MNSLLNVFLLYWFVVSIIFISVQYFILNLVNSGQFNLTLVSFKLHCLGIYSWKWSNIILLEIFHNNLIVYLISIGYLNPISVYLIYWGWYLVFEKHHLELNQRWYYSSKMPFLSFALLNIVKETFYNRNSLVL